jgi:eukaryotic-like serine/threonine-protein kinase
MHERWPQVKALFQAAIERPPHERAAFLQSATAGDDTLRRDVESLLAADASDHGLLDTMPVAAVPLETHHRIGVFEIIELIGAGAMGQVYRARDTRLNRDVAIKVLPPLLAVDPDRVMRFRREAQVLAALNHPNIAALYGLEESDGVQALVLEFVDGPTLTDRLWSGPLPLDEVFDLARQIAEALEAAHDKGIIHRDLKPANIKITPQGVAKVLDFGLARAWDGASDAQLAAAPTLTATLDRERGFQGTPAYMSPEQARGRPLDKRTDIWSYGCVLFEMLTGRPAFAGDTISDTIVSILDREPHWEALPPSTPGRVRDLLRRCVQKDLHWRLRDIGDVRIELDDASRFGAVGDVAVGQRPVGRGRAAANLGLAILATIAIAVVGSLIGRLGGSSVPAFRQLTFRHGTIGGARLAADGKTVIFRATWSGGHPELFIIRPESLQAGAIGLTNAGIYSVSSQGEMAVSLGCRLNWGECLGTLALVPMLGGRPREMVKDVLGADWSPDGKQLAIVSFNGDMYGLQYPVDNVLYQTTGWITSARVSPQGNYIAFLDHDRLGDSRGSVAVVDLDGRKTSLSEHWQSLQGLAWSADGREVWFSGSRTGKGGSSALFAVTLDGRERPVYAIPGAIKLNDVSRDGSRVLLTRGTTRARITALEASTRTERDLSWFDYSTVADLSSDGRTLLFYEWGEGVSGRPTVFIRRTDGSDPVRLGEGRPLSLSPDARWVVAIQEEQGQQLMLMPTATGELKRLARGAVIEYLDWAAWSPDGRRVFFSGRESGDVRRTYVQDVDGGEPRPVTPGGFVGIVLSPDARSILAVDRYGEFYLCAVDQREEPRPLPGYQDGDVPLQWSVDGKSLFIREAGNLTLRIHTLDIATGGRRFWRELGPADPTVLTDIGSDPGQVRITRDGNHYAYTYWTFDGELYVAEGLE